MQMVMVMMLAQCGRGQFQSVGLSIGNNRLSAGERSVLVMQRSVCCGKVRLLWQRWVGWQREQETNERFGLFRKLSRVRFRWSLRETSEKRIADSRDRVEFVLSPT
jgi:hypothetical protein